MADPCAMLCGRYIVCDLRPTHHHAKGEAKPEALAKQLADLVSNPLSVLYSSAAAGHLDSAVPLMQIGADGSAAPLGPRKGGRGGGGISRTAYQITLTFCGVAALIAVYLFAGNIRKSMSGSNNKNDLFDGVKSSSLLDSDVEDEEDADTDEYEEEAQERPYKSKDRGLKPRKM